MRKYGMLIRAAALCMAAMTGLGGCGGAGTGKSTAAPETVASQEAETEAAAGAEAASEAETAASQEAETAPEDEKMDKAKEFSWWQQTNAYEIYVNSFQDSDGDGFGDLNGIRSRLDYLQSLNVGALWLTPVFASPMMDNGYDVADYYAINPRYGTMEDMESLIAEAKERNIRIVMDLVYNHTSDQHEWFIESSASRDNPRSDWYIWRDPKEDGSAPNNWRGIFGGSAWTWCEARQQYYLHTFAAQQPDLNWANPEVRQALYDIANFWADKGAGGFRMDAIPYIKKPDDFSDGPADDSEGMASIHDMTVNTDGILDYLREFRANVTDGRDIFTVGEANGIKPDDLKDWVGENGVFNMLFEFSHVNLEFDGAEVWCKAKDWKLADLKRALSASQAATAENGWYPIFFENHDKPRSISHYFPEDADPVLAGRAMGTILLTLRGTPFLYQGEELGYRNVRWDSIDDYDELNSEAQYRIALQEGFSEEEAMECVWNFSRDNSRTPMQWDGSANAGFTSGKPWLPVHEEYESENVEAESKDPGSVLSWYRELASFRAASPALLTGDYVERLADHEQIYAYTRSTGGETLLVMVNMSGEEASYDLAGEGLGDFKTAKILLDSLDDAAGASGDAAGTLRPYEAVIMELP